MRKTSELEKPGNCTTCGEYAKFRNTAGQCSACHNADYYKWKKEREEEKSINKQKGIEYWKERGINIGDKVKTFAVSWFGLGGEEVFGIAKTGCNGAYVSSKAQRGKLAPNNWVKA